MKEIFRNLCIIILSKFTTSMVKSSKENMAVLTTSEQLLTMAEEITTNYRYDKLMREEDMSIISNCDSSYDLNESILNLPIYRASLFYNDLQTIYNDCVKDVYRFEEENCIDKLNERQEQNLFYNEDILPSFTKQFGEIIPRWSGLTVPKGVDRYYNQPAEGQMHIAKYLLIEKQLELGAGRVKPTRFLKLMRTLVFANHTRYMSRVPRRGLNHGRTRKNGTKATEKDNSKVKKKLLRHARTKSTFTTKKNQRRKCHPTFAAWNQTNQPLCRTQRSCGIKQRRRENTHTSTKQSFHLRFVKVHLQKTERHLHPRNLKSPFSHQKFQ